MMVFVHQRMDGCFDTEVEFDVSAQILRWNKRLSGLPCSNPFNRLLSCPFHHMLSFTGRCMLDKELSIDVCFRWSACYGGFTAESL